MTHNRTAYRKILHYIKYPKLILLIFTFVLAYALFKEREVAVFHDSLLSLGYFGTFLAGIFFVYGFTAAPASALLLIFAQEQNILYGGLIAGLGALAGDLLIFSLIRHSFRDEIRKLSREKALRHFHALIPHGIKKYCILALAGFIIASPLPDEVGVSLLVGMTKISKITFSIVSYILNTSGIFMIMVAGTLL